MPQWQALSKETHQMSGWEVPTHYQHLSSTVIVPACAAELGYLLPHFVLAFAKREDGRFQLQVVLGLRNGDNAYLSADFRWKVPYIPASIRGYPFNLLSNQQGEKVLAVDAQSAFFHKQAKPNDQPVLDENGAPAESLSEVVPFLLQRDAQQQQTDQATDLLDEFGVLEPWMLPVKNDQGQSEERDFMGLYRINEHALQALSGEQLARLTNGHAGVVAYGQLFSQVRLNTLHALQKQLDNHRQDSASVDLDEMFGERAAQGLFSF